MRTACIQRARARTGRTRRGPGWILLAIVTFAPACRTTPEPPAAARPSPAITNAGPLDPDLLDPEARELAWWRDSMISRDERLGWWRQARFGMFVHWGVYSALGGVWEGKPVKGYAEHIQRIRKIPRAVYRAEVAGRFAPSGFDPDAWMLAAKSAGMSYFVITAKHHDGFAMYDTAVGDYDVVAATPYGKDPMRALADAARRHGLKFGFYYSHAFDWGESVGVGNDWEHENPGGDRHLKGGRDWWETTPEFVAIARQYVDGKAIPQLKELIANYDPDILWFDTPHKLPPQENLRILRAVREAKPRLVVNGRIVQPVKTAPPGGWGDYQSTADRPAEFPPQAGDWEGIPTTNESYGWHQQDHSHKKASDFVVMLAKAAARGGNILLNIGPRGDGRIDEPDLAILEGIAGWMKTNASSIAGTARTSLPVQAWGESTLRGRTLHLHVFHWPRDGKLVVGGLKSDVKAAYLMADPKRTALPVERTSPLDLSLRVPSRAPDATDSVVVLELAEDPQVDEARLLNPGVRPNLLRAFDGRLSPGLRFGAGKVRDAWVHGFTSTEQVLTWPVRLLAKTRFTVSIRYDASADAGGRFELALGDERLSGTVVPSEGKPIRLGEVTLPAGAFAITARGTAVTGKELFRLRAVELEAR